jgi:alpha-L-fucosidase
MTSRRAFLRDTAWGLTGAATTAAVTAAVTPSLLHALAATRVQPARPRPSASQLAWQQDELALFLHFGVNTFTDREWGDGTESPTLFTPSRLDTRQWARAAKAAGAKAMILTAKHHDGFCLWPTETTQHSVRSSLWKRGQGDVVREFVDACRAEKLKVGLYCSPGPQSPAPMVIRRATMTST